MEDIRRQSEETSIYIGACMEPSTVGEEPHRAYTILKHWYWYASAQALNPSWTDTEKVRGDFNTLYQVDESHPPGLPLATHINPDKVNDDIPLAAEVEAAVQCLIPHRAGVHTHLCADHFKQLRREAYHGEQLNNPTRRE